MKYASILRGCVFLIAIFLAGCTTTQQANVALVSKWQGKSSDSFFMRYGPPASSYRMNDGRMMYLWAERNRSFSLPDTSTSTAHVTGNSVFVTTTTSPGGEIDVQCSLRLIVKNGTIEQIQAQSDSIGVWQMSRCNEVFGGKG